MSFDINSVATGMLSVIKDTVETNWKNIQETATAYIQNKKARLEQLAQMRLNNEIDEEFFQRRLGDEKKILQSELLSLKIISLAIAQKAANEAMDLLGKTVHAALKF